MHNAHAFEKKDIAIPLGDQTVHILVEDRGQGPTIVHLHQNEKTALRAARRLHPEIGGRLLTLKHRGARNIGFMLAHRHYEFDPNRIFTKKGIHDTLTKFSRYDQAAAGQVEALAKAILKEIPSEGILLAVHNNSNYSMKDYFVGKPLHHDISDLHHPDNQFLRNFFFVTNEPLFNQLKSRGFNVVLQNNSNVSDDGSLSVAMAHRPYINIEAGYNQLNQQIAMIKAAFATA